MPSGGTTYTVRIANGGTTSTEADLRGLQLLGIKFPAALTGATFAIHVGDKPIAEGGTYGAVSTSSGGAATVFAPAGSAGTVTWLTGATIGNCMVRVVSSGAEGAQRDLVLFVKGM